MSKLRLLLPLVLLCSSTYFACNKDDITTLGPGATVTFAGRITDESDQAVEGARVMAGGENATTDKNGVFRLKSVRLDSRNAKLFVSKPGYFDFSRAYVVQDAAIQTVAIQLLKKVQVGTVQVASGGTINIPGGATISFPSNAVSDKIGNPVSGFVNVYARYLDPTDPNLGKNMPGDLRGLNAAGEEGILATFGMLGVEIESQSGQVLQVASGSQVEIRMPISAEKASAAPAEIPLWHYNLATARWEEEGSAQKVGNEYIGKVSHFSFWNCDAFSETVYMRGKVFLRSTQTPLANAEIKLTVVSNGFTGYAFTNGNGWYGGAVPKGFEMILEVVVPDLCGGQVLYTQNIGPLTEDTELPDIILTGTGIQTINISGTLVNCSGAVVTNGYVYMEVQNIPFTTFTASDGSFYLTLLDCLNSNSANIRGYDLTNLLESEPVAFSLGGSAINLGNIQVCNSLGEYIEYTVDGQQNAVVQPTAWVTDDSTGGQFITSISSMDSMENGIQLRFRSNNQPGVFDIHHLWVRPPNIVIDNIDLSTTVTAAAPNIGDEIVGSFGGTFQGTDGTTHTISGSYRVIRDW